MLLMGPPIAAYAAAGAVTATGQGARISIDVLLGLVPLDIRLPDPARTWNTVTGGAAQSANVVGTNVPGVLNLGAVSASAGPSAPGGATGSGGTAGLSLLGAVSVGAISTSCTMNASTLASTTDIANLNIGGAVVNPSANLAVGVPGVLNATVDRRIVAYNSGTGKLDYTVRALDIGLLEGGAVLDGSVIVGESICSGIVKLGAVNRTPASFAPGENGTPRVTVTNTGDVAAPNTTIRIPLPPTGYTLGTPTVGGGGTCTTNTTHVVCTGVTVPGNGNVAVSLPVSLAASAVSAADWSPAASTITAVSTPVAAVTGTTISVSGGGTLVNRLAARSTSGSVTVTPNTLAAGKQATTTVTVTNDGPSDATTTVTIPLADKPAGISVVSATVGGVACGTNATAITCPNVTVPGGGTATVSVRAAATTTTAPGVTWTVTGVTASLNGVAVSGDGRLFTVSDPDVNLDAGVSITPATAVPGDGPATPTVRVRNLGIIPATGTTITLPAPPAGYAVGAVTTTGGGTCTSTAGIRCTGVTVPATGTVTVSVPVTLAPGVTANWSAGAGDPVTATSGDSTGTATGAIVTADPRWTLTATATGPAARTVRPGQPTTMTVVVSDNGPSDARNASYVVVAPQGTTFDSPRTGAAADCTQLSPTTVRCTDDIPKAGPAITLTLPLLVSAQADPATPLTGGCASLNDDTDCDDPQDVPLPSIQLRTPIANRLTVTTTAATVVPGRSGTGTVGLSSTQDEDDLVVTIPTTGLPTGFTVTGTTAPSGASCVAGTTAISCTGVDLTAGAAARTIGVTVAVASSVTPPATWNVSPATVSDGGEQVTTGGALTVAGTPEYQLTATVSGPADNTVEPGETTELNLTVRNAGPSDAPATVFGVIPPTGTTFGTPAGAAATACTVAPGGASASCTVTLAAGVSSPQLTLPVVIPGGADVTTPYGGACVDLNNNGTCGGAPDVAFDPIMLKVPFDQRVTVSATPATVTPGDEATATLDVNAVHGDLSGLTVTVPLVLPAGLSVRSATLSGATCTVGASIVCTGVGAENGTSAGIAIVVAAVPSAATGTTWTATGVTVSDGTDQVTASPLLATVGAAGYRLRTTVTVPDPGTLQPGDGGTIGVNVENLGPSDAVNAQIQVIAPAGVTFGPLTAPTADDCTLSPDNLRAVCTFDLADEADADYAFPIVLAPGLDPDEPVEGGCVDLNNNGVCDPGIPGTPGDPGIPAIYLATPLADVLTVGTTPGTIVPGLSGTGRVTLKATRPESGLSVSIPLDELPPGFTAPSATVDGGTCTTGPTAITCTGVTLTAGTQKDVIVQVAVASSVVPPVSWSVSEIVVSDGTDSVTGTGTVAVAGPPRDAVTATVTGPPDGTVTAGGTTALTVVVTNAGPSDATARTFTVTAPTSTTFGPLTGDAGTSCVRAGDTVSVTCTVTLAATASTPDLVLPLLVDADADPFTPHGGGCVNLSGTPGCAGTGDKPVPPIVLKVPFDRRAQLVTAAATVTPGTEETATVGVTALHGALSNLTLTVPLGAVPGSLTVTPADAACTTAGGQIRCTGITVADGQTTSVTLRVRATPAAAEGTSWTATGVTVDAGGGDQLTGDRQLAVVGPPVAPLSAVVTAPQNPILPGGSGTLTVDVDDLGPSDRATATIGIAVPAGSTLGTLTGLSAQRCTANPARTRLTCTFSITAAADPLRFEVPLDVPAGADPRTPLPGGCVDLNNDNACTEPTDKPIPPLQLATPFSQQVTISTTPATVTPGRTGVARVVVATDPAQTGLTIVVPLTDKPGYAFVGTPSVAPNGTCVSDATQVRCTGVSIAAGNAATVRIPLSVTAAAPASATWTAAGITVTDQDNATATSTGVLLNTGTASYRLTGTTTGPEAGTVLPGETAEVTLTLDNTGPSDAADAPVTVNAPPGTTFGPLSGPAADSCTASPAGTALACRVSLAATDDPLTWTLPIRIPADRSTATAVTGGCADLDGDNACGGTYDVVLPDITLRATLDSLLTVSADNPAITPGDTGTATLSVQSSQQRDGVTVRIDTATLPAGLTLTTATRGGTNCPVTGGIAECTGVDLAAGGTVRIALALSADPGAAAAPWSPSVTIVRGAETATRTVPTATVGAPVHPLSVAVQVPAPGTLLPGSTGDLDVTVTNAGPSLYRQARVRFVPPTGLTFAPLTTPASTFCTGTATLVDCTRDLPEGDLTFVLGIVVPATAETDEPYDDGCYDANIDGACTNPPDTYFPPIDLETPLDEDVTLSTDPGTAVPGGPAVSGYVVADADAARTGLTLTVPTGALPAGFTITGATGPAGSTCTRTAGIVCTGVDLSTGSQRVLTVTATAAANLGTGVTWKPAVTLTDGSGQSIGTATTLIGTGDPDVDITYVSSLPAGTTEPGGSTTLTVTVDNVGVSDATGVTTGVVAPAGTTFGALTGDVLADCAPNPAADRLACRFDLAATAAPRLWSIPIPIPADAAAPAVLGGGCLDKASDGACTGDDPLPAVNVSRTLSQALTVSADNVSITPGNTRIATVTVTSADARAGLTVTVPFAGLPTGVTVTAARQGGTTDCVIATGTATCSGISLTAGGSTGIALTLSATAAAAQGVWSPAIAVAQAAATVTRTVAVATVGAAASTLTVTVVPPAPGTVLPGGVATLAVTVANSGPSNARARRVAFTAPAGTTFGTPSVSYCVLTTTTVATCTVDVDAASDVRFTLPVNVPASATAGTPLPGGCVDSVGDTGCDDDLPPIVLGVPFSGRVQLSVTPATVTPGTTTNAFIRTTSTATTAVTGTTIVVPLTGLPAGLTVTGYGGPNGSTCTRDTSPNQVRCTGVTVAQGTGSLITLAVNATAALRAGVTWTATGITLTAGTESATGGGTLAVTGTPVAPVTASLVGPGGTLSPADITSLAVTVVNPGPSDATGVTATVTAPSNSAFGALSGQAAIDCTAAGTTTLSCRFDQAVGAGKLWTVPVVVSSAAVDGDLVAAGCVTVGTGTAVCGGSATVVEQAADRPVRDTATLTITPATVPAGTAGSGTIAISSEVDQDALTLTVPLAGKPAGMTVTGATAGDAACTVTTSTITCPVTGLIAGQDLTVTIAVTVGTAVTAGTAWQAAGVKLANNADVSDFVTGTGTLVTTTAAGYTVTVTVGAPSIPRPAPGQTTVLPITLSNSGPQDAAPYTATIVLPTGTTHGTLPAGCAEGSSERVVTCTLPIAADETVQLALPLVVSSTATVGTTLTGGCVDAGTTGTCGGTGDLALPNLTVVAPTVDLDIEYSDPAPTVVKGKPILLKLPYSNNGSQSASDVSFLIDPPAGTTLTKALVLLDASTAAFTAQATAADTVQLTCEAAPDVDANAVTCTGPEAPVGSSSELWLYLAVARTAQAGKYPVTVQISTTSAEGNTVNNTATAELTITAAATDDPGDTDDPDDTGDGTDDNPSTGTDNGGDGLPKTGKDLTGLILLAVLMVLGGGVARVGARDRGPRKPTTPEPADRS
ncbi:beta strand repeat-containing protein [Actinoplanes sp. NPDC051494]|uniref:beta strand repeat-containing protein n=1 Tax=Actinoplanes sp. NPDC051494 TaxID=3363907 RepID=UPI0037990BDC